MKKNDIFSQEFAVERYGNEKYSDGYEYGLETGRIEGKVEGKIEGIAEIVKNYAKIKNISILQAIRDICVDEETINSLKKYFDEHQQ